MGVHDEAQKLDRQCNICVSCLQGVSRVVMLHYLLLMMKLLRRSIRARRKHVFSAMLIGYTIKQIRRSKESAVC